MKDRIGYHAGSTPLEKALQTAVSREYHYLDLNADRRQSTEALEQLPR